MPNSFSRTTRSLANDSSRGALLAWAFGAVTLGAWLSWFAFSSVTINEVSSQARLEVNHSVHPISSLVAGKVASVDVELGETVQAGSVLLTLDASAEQLALAAEQARLQALPPQLALLEDQLAAKRQARHDSRKSADAAMAGMRSSQAGADAAEAFANDYAERLQQLSRSGQTAMVETLRAQAESEKRSSEKQAIAAELQQLELEAQSHDYALQAELDALQREIARLQGEEQTLRATVATLQQVIDQHTIHAPAAGTVGDLVLLQAGSYVEVGTRLGSIVPSSELRIVAEFPPAAVVGRIKPGLPAEMRLDGFPWAQFGTLKAQVSRVGSEIRDNRVQVEFELLEDAQSPIDVQHGLPGTVEVSIEHISPAVLVLRKSGQLLDAKQSWSPAGNTNDDDHR